MGLPGSYRLARRSSDFGRFPTEGAVSAKEAGDRNAERRSLAGGARSPHNRTRYRKTGLKEEDVDMVRNKLILAAAVLSGVALAAPAAAQNEQFIPILSYRTGAYAVNGVPFANGMADYYNLINERDGGINGVKLLVEECETGYATDKGVECYERLKGKGPTGAGYFSPLSPGITLATPEAGPGHNI